MKKYTNKILVATIVIVIVVVMSIPLLPKLLRSNINETGNSPTINTTIISNDLNYTNFNRINVNGKWQVHLVQGEFRVRVGSSASTQYVSMQGNTLVLDYPKNNSNQEFVVDISLPQLNALNISGKSNVVMNGFGNSQLNSANQDFALSLSGLGQIIANKCAYNNLLLAVSGAADVKFNNCKLCLKLNLQVRNWCNYNIFLNRSEALLL